MAFDLTGRVALVTGAGQGVGAGIAEALSASGAAVAVDDIDARKAEAVAARLPGRSTWVAADVTDEEAVTRMVADVEGALGPVDILVNNAGVGAYGPVTDTPVEDFERLMRVNYFSAVYATKAVLTSMVGRGRGHVVNLASVAGRFGAPLEAAYSASKFAMVGFTEALAFEVGPQGVGVTVNCLSLGTIFREGVDEERLARRYPVGRLGRPADVAAAAVYLASEEAAWVTGQTLPVNGGSRSS